jgi:hypothetical protein
VAAIAAGIALPAIGTPELDTAALTHTKARLASISAAHSLLKAEHEARAEEAGAAAGDVHAKVNAVMDHVARRMITELYAARDKLWALEQSMSGYFETRQGDEELEALKEKIRRDLDRREVAVAANPAFLETHKYLDRLASINAVARARWDDFGRRLQYDPDAALDGKGGAA